MSRDRRWDVVDKRSGPGIGSRQVGKVDTRNPEGALMTGLSRRRPSPALVISILALTLAVGGGATAIAISDSARDKKIALRVFKKSIQGPLPSGATLRGRFAVAGHRVTGGATPDLIEESSVSFPVPLAHKPIVHAIGTNGAPTADCPGSGAAPKAAAGNLCLYEAVSTGNTGITLVNLSRFGFSFFATGVPANTNYELEGAWAVQAGAAARGARARSLAVQGAQSTAR
jgi:hypothetical protein